MKSAEQRNSDFERLLEARDSRRQKSEERYLERLERREDSAEQLIGEVIRNGVTVFYVNCLDRAGRLTGRTREGSRSELVSFCLRNNYV